MSDPRKKDGKGGRREAAPSTPPKRRPFRSLSAITRLRSSPDRQER